MSVSSVIRDVVLSGDVFHVSFIADIGLLNTEEAVVEARKEVPLMGTSGLDGMFQVSDETGEVVILPSHPSSLLSARIRACSVRMGLRVSLVKHKA